MNVKKLRIAIKAVQELGLQQVYLYGLYRLGMRSGHYRRLTPAHPAGLDNLPEVDLKLFQLPDREIYRQCLGERREVLLSEAEEILSGKIRFFGGDQAAFDFSLSQPLKHWSLTRENYPGQDIKLIWEPARLGWVFVLCRAFWLTNDEKYAEACWQNLEKFWQANPVNLGPNWSSAQEVAIRIWGLIFAGQVLPQAGATTPERMARLTASLMEHARRIPPTLVYAQAQNNNHLVSEAVGLYLAGCCFPKLPEAQQWKRLGWQWFNWAIQVQVADDGTYIQQSMNYHRLVLDEAVLFVRAASLEGDKLPQLTQSRLQAAAGWLLGQLDLLSGKVPNLGHNDGARVLPLAAGDFSDYFPTAQTAANVFFHQGCLEDGYWNEPCLWLGSHPHHTTRLDFPYSTPAVHRLGTKECWGTIRAVQFHGRPAHADQLHVDLWWQGQNVAMDAGTYAYNLPQPWENGLAHTQIHNTVTVDYQDQMERAGRFLWLNRAQATWQIDGQSISAQHSGYRQRGILHARKLEWFPPCVWQVIDRIEVTREPVDSHCFSLHWLLPDWLWELREGQLFLAAPMGKIAIKIAVKSEGNQIEPQFRIIRAGQVILGKEANQPTFGWVSPTYLKRYPALSFQIETRHTPPLEIVTTWEFDPQPANSLLIG